LTSRGYPLVARLLECAPAPLHAREAVRVLFPSGRPTEATQRRAFAELRRRLAVVGLALRLRPRVGYTLERSPWLLDGTVTPRYERSTR
jgi:hypothetical protein